MRDDGYNEKLNPLAKGMMLFITVVFVLPTILGCFYFTSAANTMHARTSQELYSAWHVIHELCLNNSNPVCHNNPVVDKANQSEGY